MLPPYLIIHFICSRYFSFIRFENFYLFASSKSDIQVRFQKLLQFPQLQCLNSWCLKWKWNLFQTRYCELARLVYILCSMCSICSFHSICSACYVFILPRQEARVTPDVLGCFISWTYKVCTLVNIIWVPFISIILDSDCVLMSECMCRGKRICCPTP